MYSDLYQSGIPDLAPEFARDFEAFLDSRIGLDRLCRCIVRMLSRDASQSEAIREALDIALRDSKIGHASFETLSAEVDRFLDENEPTVPPHAGGSLTAAVPPPDIPVLVNRVHRLAFGQPAASGDLLRNRYQLLEQVNSGGMGDIFQAIDTLKTEAGAPNPWVAVKVIRKPDGRFSSALNALVHEAGVTQKLSHPNIIRVFTLDRDDQHLFMTMEWLEGESLARILTARGENPLSELQTKMIVDGLCEGLAHVHRQGIVHADIKPGNILILRNGQPKLLDFGAAHMIGETPENSPGRGSHTPAYASGQILAGKTPTVQDDIFSLACVIYRMLGGHRPFGDLNAADAELEDRQPAPIASLNRAQWEALRRALSFRREDRQPSVAALQAELLETAPPGRRWQPARRSSQPAEPGTSLARKLRSLLMFGGTLAVAAAVVLLID